MELPEREVLKNTPLFTVSLISTLAGGFFTFSSLDFISSSIAFNLYFPLKSIVVGLTNVPSGKFTALGGGLLALVLGAKILYSGWKNAKSNNYTKSLLATTSVVLIVTGAAATYSLPEHNIGETETVAAESYNQMGFEMVETMHGMENENTNILFSPLSIGIAYSMVYAGTEGATHDELKDFLNVNVEDKKFHRSNRELLKTLGNPEPSYTYHRMFGLAKNVETNLANGIWFRDGINYRKSYSSDMRKYYDANVQTAPFNDKTVKDINSWTSRNTKGEIKKIVKKLDPKDVAVLVNAVYFYGEWTNQFDEEETDQEKFTLKDGSNVTVPMMEKEETELQYVEFNQDWEKIENPGQRVNRTLQAARIPYGETGRIGMYVVLPKDIDSFVEELDQQKWSKITESMEKTEIDLKMPKYKAEYDADLKKVTEKMGLEKPYQPTEDFQSMAEEADSIGKAKHKATIKVNEEGTEAAAATALIVKQSATLRPEMTVDQPFMFAIVDEKSGSIMFQGIVQNPG